MTTLRAGNKITDKDITGVISNVNTTVCELLFNDSDDVFVLVYHRVVVGG